MSTAPTARETWILGRALDHLEPGRSLRPYGMSKRALESEWSAIAARRGVTARGVRTSEVWLLADLRGPTREDIGAAVADIVAAGLADGGQVRPVVNK